MKFGLIPVNIGVTSAEDAVGLAQLAENSGFESVWTFEHVMVPLEYQSKYPYNESGRMGADPEANFIDPLITLAAIATCTKTLRLGTGVNILSQVNPLYMAKQAASLDLISNGRFMLGVGIGWLKEEFEALGVPFEKRGARFDDYVTAMRKIWSGDTVEHQSEFVSWSGFKSYPIPKQNPMPVVIGGIKGKIHERIARHGNGWYAPTNDLNELNDHLGKIREKCDEIDRDFSEIEITCMWPGSGGREGVESLSEIGVHRLVVPLMGLGADPVAGISRLAEEVIA